MEFAEIVNDNHLEEKFRLLLEVPAFIGDLPRLYESRFGEHLDFGGGLLKFVDSSAFLDLQGSNVEYTESKRDPVGNHLLFGTLEGRLKFLLPKSRTLFYEELPKLYKSVFGETFESGPHLLHFIENHPCLRIDSFIYVSYNDQEAVIPRPLPAGNPRHKDFLTKRFIYILRLFPKSPADLALLYKQNFGEELPVKVNLLPAIFKNFLSDYFMVSSSNVIWFAAPRTTPKVHPEIPHELLGMSNPDSHHPVIDRLIYLKHTRRLESRYLQFMYYDVFGEPITDFAILKQFINAAYESTTEYHLDAYDLAQIYEPDKAPSFHDTLKEFLLTGPKKIQDVLDTCLKSRGFPIEIFKTENAFKELLVGIPGVLIQGTVVELAQNSPTYVNRQLCDIILESSLKLSELPRLFKEYYGYTMPDDFLVREYVLAGDALQIDADGVVMKKSVEKKPSEKAASPPVTGDTSVTNRDEKRNQTQKKNVLKLLNKRATRLDRIREEYRQRFGRDLVLDTKLSAWIQTVDGVHLDIKTQMVSSGLTEPQVKVITLLLEIKQLNFEAIPAECKKRFGKDLAFKGQLKSWLCNIPGLVIDSSKMCTYNQTITGGSMLNLSAKKLVSNFSVSTPDIRPRSQEEQAVDLIVAHPNSTLNEFLQKFHKQHGKFPSYGDKLKTWLLSIPGVEVSPNDRINLRPKDVATNAKQNIVEILKHKKWIPVEVFAEDYRKLFGVSGSLSWIQSRQKDIDFLMLLNNKVRYEELDARTCIQYVKYLAKLCGGIPVQQVDTFFPLVYGFRLPASMLNVMKNTFPTGVVRTGQCVDLKSEIDEILRDLDSSRARALIHLKLKKSWIRIEDLIKETCVQVQNMSEIAFCESIPSVMMKNSRVKYHSLTPRSLLAGIERIVSWLGVVQVPALSMLFKRLFGVSVESHNLPLNDLKFSPHLEVVGYHLRTKTPHRLSAVRPIAPAELINHSDNQLHRLFRIVSQNPNIELGKLECMYEEKFGAPIISLFPSFKLCVDYHQEFLVTNAKVTLVVPLSEALRDLSMNQLSSAQSVSKPMLMSKMNISAIDPRNGTTLASGETSNVSNSTTEYISSSDSHSDTGIATKPSNVTNRPSQLKPTESSFFDSLIGDRERSMTTLCNDYKNKFKNSISEAELQQLLVTAGYCCTGGNAHYSCKQRLLFMLSARALSQSQVIIEFNALFSRSPCYDGTLRKYLLSLGCVESAEKLFRFPLKRVHSAEMPKPELMERLLPILEFRNRSFEVSRILDEYNKRYDPPLTEAELVAELKELDFVFLTKKKKAFDCGGIHEATFEAMSEYLRRDKENAFSLPDLARELPAKTGSQLIYFGNLLKALQHVGFNVSNDQISYAAKPNSSKSVVNAEEKLAAAVDLTGLKRVIRNLLRLESSLTYGELEEKLVAVLGYRIKTTSFGCSDFASFLRLYLPDEGMQFSDDIVELVQQSNSSKESSPTTSPSHSSDQSCSTVFDVLNVSGPLLYPSELQAKFTELTGGILSIPDPGAYLETLLRATELVVRSDKHGHITISKPLSSDSEEEI